MDENLDEADLDEAVGTYSTLLGGGMQPERAQAQIARMFGAESVQQVLDQFDRLLGGIVQLGDPPTLVDSARSRGWYTGPRPGDRHWPALIHELKQGRGWASDDIESLDRASTRIVTLLPPPGADAFSARGLVMGYVQSGKTTNFTAVIAKAADAGYKGFIVLGGLHNVLRNQTQKRLEADLEALNSQLWTKLTSRDIAPANGTAGKNGDFAASFPAGVDAFLTNLGQQRVLAVVKKNVSRLRALRRWITGGTPLLLQNCPFLVIDDEADQASLNTAADERRRTRINDEILRLLQVLPKSVYIGYTATPFANFFVNPEIPEQLYPRDFIVSLPRPNAYFGAERLFGRQRLDTEDESDEVEGLDMIRYVEPAEVAMLRPPSRAAAAAFVPAITPSVWRALSYFWLATAARRVRAGGANTGPDHSTMLIHTTERVPVHGRMCDRLGRERARVLGLLRSSDQALLGEWGTLWAEESARVHAEDMGERPVHFEELKVHLEPIVEQTAFIEENGQSLNRLSYEVPGVTVVVGGNVLSRGLTLEGLIASLFVRTANTYDTLLQMGRWFGYRRGYSDLPRMWMTADLADNFRSLSLVEHEVREDVARYEIEGVTPLSFAPRVRTHPSMAITAAMKMRHAKPCSITYSDTEPQTTAFAHMDRVCLQRNQDAARSLIADLVAAGIDRMERDGRVIFRSATADHIVRFLSRYQSHERSHEFRPGDMAQYIQRCNAGGELDHWNVVFVGKRSDGPRFDFGHGVSTRLLNRARLKVLSDSTTASLGAVLSARERVADLELPAAELVGIEKRHVAAALRHKYAEGAGLLLIYAIDKESGVVSGHQDLREALRAVEDVIAAAAIFPHSELDATVYVSVHLPGTDDLVEDDEDVLVSTLVEDSAE